MIVTVRMAVVMRVLGTITIQNYLMLLLEFKDLNIDMEKGDHLSQLSFIELGIHLMLRHY